MADRVIQRNDTAARWQSINPILATGEIGIEIDGAKGYKIGDGKTRWNDLPYPANPTNVVQELGNNENAVISQKVVSEKLSELDLNINKLNFSVSNKKYLGYEDLGKSFENSVVTKEIYYSEIGNSKIYGIRIVAHVGDVKVYKVKSSPIGSLSSNVVTELITSFINTDEEEGIIKDVPFEGPIDFAEDEYLGILGSVYFGKADGYNMYKVGISGTITNNYVLAFNGIVLTKDKIVNIENDITKINNDIFSIKRYIETYDNILSISSLDVTDEELLSINYSIAATQIYLNIDNNGDYISNCKVNNVRIKAHEGIVHIMLLSYNEDNVFTVLSTIASRNNTASEEGKIIEIPINYNLGQNETIGITGSVYFGQVNGHTMIQAIPSYAADKNFIIGVSVEYIKYINSEDVKNNLEDIKDDVEDIKDDVSFIKNKLNGKNTVIVAKDGSGDFTTISKAVSAINYDTEDNPVTIIIRNGEYNEYVNVYGQRHLSFIGEDRKRCIWRYGSGNYSQAPLRVSGDCHIANLTFISDLSNYTSPTDGLTGYSVWKRDVLAGVLIGPEWYGFSGSYCVHIDDSDNMDTLAETVVENCTMISYSSPCIGMGVWPSTKIIIRNCDLNKIEDTDVYNMYPNGAVGVIYAHGLQSTQNHGEYGEEYVFDKNIIHTNYGSAIRLQKAASIKEDLKIKFYNNIIISDNVGEYDLIRKEDVLIDNTSFGNNVEI